jgi:dihydroorotase
MFDLLIKGGHVVDASAGYNGRLDVAVKRSRVAAVERDIPSAAAHVTIDASGQYVTPGLVDLHAHVYNKVTVFGIDADQVGSQTGVTTWLDAGSAGAYSLRGFRDFIVRPASVRIHCLLNISCIGLVGSDYEVSRLEWCDVGLFKRMVTTNRDLVLGVKVRMGPNAAGDTGIGPLERARQAADRCELPLMVHIGFTPPELSEIIPMLKPGDILTHCFTGHGMRIIDSKGRLLDFVKEAWDRGIVLDVGHGSGSFSYETTEAMMSAGYEPDVISTDIHQWSMAGPMYDMPTTLSKFLSLGMSLPNVILAASARPAQILGMEGEIGTLKPGALADIALFELLHGSFTFYDSMENERQGHSLLRNTLTVVGGRPLTRREPDPPAPWIEGARDGDPMDRRGFQRELERRGLRPEAMAEAARLSLTPST